MQSGYIIKTIAIVYVRNLPAVLLPHSSGPHRSSTVWSYKTSNYLPHYLVQAMSNGTHGESESVGNGMHYLAASTYPEVLNVLLEIWGL